MQDPVNIIMLIILVVTEVPAAIFLIVAWKKDCREAREREDGEDG